jgi:hypothetical protein
MSRAPNFEDYLASLGRLTAHVDPTAHSPQAVEIKEAADSLAGLAEITVESLVGWVREHPKWVPALGLAVGLSQEKLKNALRDRFGTSGWQTLATSRPGDLIGKLDEDYDLIRSIATQRVRSYTFGDVLVARGGTRLTAARAGAAGRKVEDEIEEIARGLGLPYETRTRFVGTGDRTAPCDLVVPNPTDAAIVVAAKAFDSTGSKLTDAVREVEEMANVRKPRQFVMAVIDGIGWKGRQSDLRKIHDLWRREAIDGMYTLATLGDFRSDLEEAARLRHLL